MKKVKLSHGFYEFITLVFLTIFSIWNKIDEVIIGALIVGILMMPFNLIEKYEKYILKIALFEVLFSISIANCLFLFGVIGNGVFLMIAFFGIFLALIFYLEYILNLKMGVMKMNKVDINKNKLEIGDIVVLCKYIEATSREFEFWEVIADNEYTNHLVFIKGLTTGKTDCFSCDGLKKVNKKYKELVDKATQKNVQKVTSGNGEPYLPRECGLCPKCSTVVNYHTDKYCHECGQKLNGADEE